MSWGRRRNDDWGGWPRYVPVAERRERARKQAEKLRKKGDALAPVVVTGRTIAATFWGKAWCRNLERYGDYENRIPRGRAYVRNGSVLDLKIGTAQVDALVSGSHLYAVAVEIRPLKAKVWKEVTGACTGRIGSLLELLQGKLSGEVMEIVTRPGTRLFPEPADISFRCSCPDWASMCKHVAAVLYGIGARLDGEPELLFRLRDVDHRELIAAPAAADLAAAPGTGVQIIAEEDLSGIFGIEIDEGPAGRSTSPTPGRSTEVKAASTDAGRPTRDHVSQTVKTAVPPAAMAEPARPRRGRPPKTAAAAPTPEPPKPKRGRPRSTPKTGSADEAAPLPKEEKRERPQGRTASLRAGRDEVVLKRQEAGKAVGPRRKTAAGRGGAGQDAAPDPTSVPLPTRRRGRPPKKRTA